MVSKAQLRILTWLSKHPDNVKNSWDVSRELSLPGIAEGLGVVRSALNVPLTKLEQEDFISKRMACLLYTSPSPRDRTRSRMPSSA